MNPNLAAVAALLAAIRAWKERKDWKEHRLCHTNIVARTEDAK